MTTIEWTNKTWNPVTGCSKVSPGCAHCYAETFTARRAGSPGWIEEHRPWTPENAGHNVRLWPERLTQPLRWRKPQMVFVNSMSDLFHELIPDYFIRNIFAVIAAAPQHIFQVLTKRPERARDLLSDKNALVLVARQAGLRGLPIPTEWPLPNVWLGTSIENRRYVDRAHVLRETPAAVRFISAEPLLGPLVRPPAHGWLGNNGGLTNGDWGDGYCGEPLDLYNIDWLIVGGESGPRHRPIDIQWVRDLHGEARAHGTAFFLKQWGGIRPKSGGRELDGRTWDEYPIRAGVAA